MVPQLYHRLFCLQFDRFQERIIRRILTASEHEVLPNEQSKLVADVVKVVEFIDSSSPDSNHVLVTVNHQLKPGSVAFLCDFGQVIVGRDPIRTWLNDLRSVSCTGSPCTTLIFASTEHPPSVHLKQETGPGSIYQSLLNKLDGSEPNSILSRADDTSFLRKSTWSACMEPMS
jgi:hypothetical protein